MSIRTNDREQVRRRYARIDHVGADEYQWICTEPGCLFHRTWSTESGAYTGVARHLAGHGVRVMLPTMVPRDSRGN